MTGCPDHPRYGRDHHRAAAASSSRALSRAWASGRSSTGRRCAAAWRLRAERQRRRDDRGRGRARCAGELPARPARGGAALGARRQHRRRGGAAARRDAVRDRPQPSRAGAPRADLARHRHLRRLPARAVRPRRPALSATRSSTAPTAARASRSSRMCPTTATRPRCASSRCARPAGPSTTTRWTGASTPSRTPARSAAPRCGWSTRTAPSCRLATTPSAEAARRLARGAILAVKGLGGYHLACDALNSEAVARLRRRKHREAKPFALMVPDLATRAQLCRGQRGRGGAAPVAPAPDRAAPAAPRWPGAPGRGAGLRHAGDHAARTRRCTTCCCAASR